MDNVALNTVEKRVIKVMYLVNIDKEALKAFNISHDILQDLAEKGFVEYDYGIMGQALPNWQLTEQGNLYAEQFCDLSS